MSQAFSMTADGTDIRFLYDQPSHHAWQDDQHILDGRDYNLRADDGSGASLGRVLLAIPPGQHRVGVDNAGADSLWVGWYSFVGAVSSGTASPAVPRP